MRASLVLAAQLATSCFGVGIVRQQQQSNLHQNGDVFTRDVIDQKGSAVVRSNQRLHYDYLGRLKTPATAQNPEGSVVVTSNSNSAAKNKGSVVVPSNPLIINDDDDTMSSGFSGTVDDLPTIDNPKQTAVEISLRSTDLANHQFGSTTATTTTIHYKAAQASASVPSFHSAASVPKAGVAGPSFHSEDSHDDHPIVVDKFQYDTHSPGWLDGSLEVVGVFELLILACAVIALVYRADISEALRGNQSKGKANVWTLVLNWATRMIDPLVQEAMGATGIVEKTAHYSHVREADVDDELLSDSGDESEEVPDLMQGEPPLDFFDDSQSARLESDMSETGDLGFDL